MAAVKESGFVAPELRREREASKLDIPELTAYIDGGEMFSEKRRRMCKCLAVYVYVCTYVVVGGWGRCCMQQQQVGLGCCAAAGSSLVAGRGLCTEPLPEGKSERKVVRPLQTDFLFPVHS